jgi:hypothetical protein
MRIAPCCQAKSQIVAVDGFDFYTNDFLTTLRTKFDAGHRPAECVRCWQDESHGKKSRRLSAIDFYKTPPSSEVLLEGLDHSSTWACNLACIMCGPEFSSTWATELDLNKSQLHSMGRLLHKKNTALDMLDTSNIKRLHFNGGEPFLNVEQIKVLDKINLENVLLSYNTNGTQYPDPRLIEQWHRAKSVRIFFSIDAVGDAFEYVRWPGRWESVAGNILKMRDQLPSNVMFGFNTTVGCYNALELADTMSWFNQHISTNREGDDSDFCYQYAFNYDIKSLTTQAKLAIINKLQLVPGLEGVVSYVQNQLQHANDNAWIDLLDQIDMRRNTNWRKVLKIGKFY